MPLLEVRDLETSFSTRTGVVRAVNKVSFDVEAGSTVAIVGESGSGKSVTSLSILRLLATPPAEITGSVRFAGKDLLTLSEKEMRGLRGNDISMIFQEPMTSLNPVFTVGSQIAEPLRLHKGHSRAQARLAAIELLEMVGIPSPAKRFDDYPHQFSGGMRQRAMIAMALACSPRLLIADEPTTALDVTIQAQVLDLMKKLQKEFNTAIMLITHDLGVVAETADEVIVMYAGRSVEIANVRSLFSAPKHPYTAGLLKAVPRIGSSLTTSGRVPLFEIGGTVPSLRSEFRGCPFAPRCERSTAICETVQPPLEEKARSHHAACHHPLNVAVLEERV